MAIAGPNGSGKTTVSALAMAGGTYVNAGDIRRPMTL
jgi:cytidylate kinase